MIDDLPLFAAKPAEEPKAEPDPALAALDAINPDELSPKEALERLYELKRLRRGRAEREPGADRKDEVLASAFDRASTACITVGIATPLAGYVYDVSGFGTRSACRVLLWVLQVGLWRRLPYIWERDAFSTGCRDDGTADQSLFPLFAFVAMPVVVVLIGYVAVRLHERSLEGSSRAGRNRVAACRRYSH